MSNYLTRFDHFKFEEDGDQILVTSENDDTFEKKFDIPSDLDVEDGKALFDRYYTDVYSAYQEYQS